MPLMSTIRLYASASPHVRRLGRGASVEGIGKFIKVVPKKPKEALVFKARKRRTKLLLAHECAEGEAGHARSNMG
jgi:hypothetical protein